MCAMVLFVVLHMYRPLVNSHICNWYIYDLPNCDVDIGFDFELCLVCTEGRVRTSPNAYYIKENNQ